MKYDCDIKELNAANYILSRIKLKTSLENGIFRSHFSLSNNEIMKYIIIDEM